MRRTLTRRAILLLAIVALITPAGLAVLAQPAAAFGPLMSTIVGGNGFGYSGDGAAANQSQLHYPGTITTDAQGNLMIGDSLNNVVRVVAESDTNPGYPLSGGTWTVGDIFTVAGTGVAGYSGDGGPSGSAQLDIVGGTSIDSGNNVLIADLLNNRVRVVAVSATNPGYPLSGCGGACTWTVGDIFTVAGTGSLGYSGDGGPSNSANFGNVYDVYLDSAGNLLITDPSNERVRIVAVSATNPGYPLSGSAPACTGSCTWTVGDVFTVVGNGLSGSLGDGGPASSGELWNPEGVVADAQGNLLISDVSDQRIRVVAMSALNPGYPLSGCAGACTWTVGDIFTVAGNGILAYSGDGGAAASAEFSNPGVTLDTQGNLLIPDNGNNRVRIVAISGSNPGYPLAGCAGTCTWTVGDVFTVAGNGTLGYSGDGFLATSAELSGPTGVAVDAQGGLLIADAGNDAIRRVAVPAPTSINVPATAGDPNGFDSRLFVNNSVTLSASGTWCNDSSIPECHDANGDTVNGVAPSYYLLPNVARFALVGRIGTTGAWHLLGSGPATLNGTGELFLAMNDGAGEFANNSGSLSVTVGPVLNISSFYFADGPTMAGTDISWEGDLSNNGDTTLTNAHFFVSDGTAQTDVPTWVRDDSGFIQQDSGNCVLLGGSLYDCVVPEFDPGDFLTVSAAIPTQGIQPGNLGDLFLLERSDQTPTCFIFSCTHGGTLASPQTQEIDGLQINITAPAQVNAGTSLAVSGTVTNTATAGETNPTDTITGITTLGTFDKGHITSAALCAFANNSPLGTGSTDRCPPSGSFALGPGDTSPTETVHIDTTGLAGQTINYTVVATSPDIGGASYVATGTVQVVPPPGVVIDTPAKGSTLGQSVPHAFTATPTPAVGDSVTSVDLQVDSSHFSATTDPYTRTIPANTLSVGTHTLTATMNQGANAPISKSITVNVVAAPTVTINPPTGFTAGGVLDTSKSFTATATPHAPAAITSVGWKIDNTITVPSSAVAPYTATVNPASLVLTNGAHTLRATATDSTGQSTTAAFNFTVPQATLSVVDPTTPASQSPIVAIAPQITPLGRASWNVEVDNPSVFVAHHVALKLEASAGPDPTPIDVSAIATALLLPNGAAAPCVPAGGEAVSCNLGEIPAGMGEEYPVYVSSGVTAGLTITVDVTASAANAPPATHPLQTVDVIDPTTCSCEISAQGPGSSFQSNSTGPTDADPAVQAVYLSPHLILAAPHAVRFRRLFQPGLREHSTLFGSALTTAIPVTLRTLDAAQDPVLCTTAQPCFGQVSDISGDFTQYSVQTNPIVAVIIERWGRTVPGTGLAINIPAHGLVPAKVKQLGICVQDVNTRAFSTPCELPEIVKTSADGNNKTTYDIVLFTGADPHFARR